MFYFRFSRLSTAALALPLLLLLLWPASGSASASASDQEFHHQRRPHSHSAPRGHSGRVVMRVFDKVYDRLPGFEDLFDEDSFYVFAACFTGLTCAAAFVASRSVDEFYLFYGSMVATIDLQILYRLNGFFFIIIF